MNTSSRNACLLALLLGVLTFALFAPALRYDFVFIDDIQYTLETPQVATGLSLANIRWAFTTVHESWYSPLLWISFMADASLFGPGPFGYHLTNILLHAANALMLFWILVRLTRSPLAAFFAAALWSLHPLRVESVVWIAERKDVLSGFFFLLAIGVYLFYVERPTRTRQLAVLFCMLCGMLSKTILIVLPPLLLLLDVWPLRRISFPTRLHDLRAWHPLFLEKLPLFVLMLTGIILTLITHQHAHDAAPPFSALARLALVAPAYFDHLKQVLWPAHLALFYPVSYPSVWICALALFSLLALLLAAWRLRKTYPFLLVGGLWFLVALAPLARGIRFDEQSAYPDRYTYLPAIGLSFLFAGLFSFLTSRSRRRLAGLSLLSIALVSAYSLRTLRYLPQWESQEAMVPILIHLVPDNPLVNNAYGQLLLTQNKPDEAIPYFEKATHWHIQASCNLATALLHAGRPQEALPIATRMCASSHPPPEAFLVLGLCHLQLDQATGAIPPLQEATRLMPHSALAWQMLYRALMEAGETDSAETCIRHLRQLNALDVTDFDGLVRLYVRTWRRGDPRLAWPFFANNVQRFPRNILLHNSAAWLLATMENPPAPPSEAVRLAQIALATAGEPHPALLDTLAAAYAAIGDFDSAIATAERALAHLPVTPDANPLRNGLEVRLRMYRSRQPFRLPPDSSRNLNVTAP